VESISTYQFKLGNLFARVVRTMEEKADSEPIDKISEQIDLPIFEVLPKSGIAYSTRDSFEELLAKPMIMPLKSAVLEKLEKLEANNS
jgi:hypothetical protein